VRAGIGSLDRARQHRSPRTSREWPSRAPLRSHRRRREAWSSALSGERARQHDLRTAAVHLTRRPLWRLRLARSLPRYLLYATCAYGLIASARFAIAPPLTEGSRGAAARAPLRTDLAARGYATLFARRYLTWNGERPQDSEAQLAPMIGAGVDPRAGLTLPPTGEQRVLWAEVVQERASTPARHVYTVAAETDTAGLLYVTVPVARDANGDVQLSGYPAFVGAPAASAEALPERASEVHDSTLTSVVERALRNYLASSRQELDADLTEAARVALPRMPLALGTVARIDWSPDHRSIVAVVQARDARGAQYTLGYEADVEEIHGRWEISALQMDSTT
jgi:hypothetical protein